MDGLPEGGLGAPPWGRCWDEGSSQPQAAPGGIPTLLGGPQVLSLWVFIGWTSKGVTHRLEPGPHTQARPRAISAAAPGGGG